MATTRLPSANGHASPRAVTKRKPSRKRQRKTPDRRVATVLAVSAGVTTPLLALAMSTLAGHIAHQGSIFAVLPALILACLLIVSTPHIAEAKRHVGWRPWQAWAFAIALDCAVACCEFLPLGQGWITTTVVFGCVAYSAALNSYVNLRHAKVI